MSIIRFLSEAQETPPVSANPSATYSTPGTFNVHANLGNNAGNNTFKLTVSCTPARATLNIVKALPNLGTGTFTFNLTQGATTGSLSTTVAGSVGSFSVAQGHQLTVAEVISSADSFTTTANCGAVTSSFDAGTKTLTLTPPAGTTSITCTFTNTKSNAGGTPDLTILKTHVGTATQGQSLTYEIVVTNSGTGPTDGTDVTVTDPLPSVFSSISASGSGWTCTVVAQLVTCKRSDVIGGGSQYPKITITATLAANATGTVTNTATVSGGGDPTPASSTDMVTITVVNGALTLTKTPSSPTFNTVGQVITYTFVVTNTGQATVDTIVVTDSNTAVSCPKAILIKGESMNCTSTYTITAADMSAGSVTNIAKANGNDPNGPVPTATATATIKRNDDFVRDRTMQVIKNFLYRREDQLLSNEPDRNRLIRRLPGTLWGDSNTQTAQAGSSFTVSSGEGGSAKIAFATSFSQMMADARAARQKKAQEQNDQMMGLGVTQHSSLKDDPLPVWNSGFDVWVEGHYSHFDDDQGKGDRSGHLGVMYVGADYLVTPGLLIGALVQFDWMTDTSNVQQTSADGHGWMAGPYVSARLSENVFFDARAAWGTSDNTVNPLGFFVDNFETDRWLVRANLTGNWNYGNWRFTPSVSVAHIEEEPHAYIDVLGISIPGQSVALGRVTFGPEVGYRFFASDGSSIEPMASIQGLWDFEKPDTLTIGDQIVSPDTFRGKVEAGVMFSMPQGATVRATGNYDGIGSNDFHAYGGQLYSSG